MTYGPMRNPLCLPASNCTAWKRVMKPFCTSTVAAFVGSGGSAAATGSALSCSAERMLLFLRRSSKSADDTGAMAAIAGRSPERKWARAAGADHGEFNIEQKCGVRRMSGRRTYPPGPPP